MTRNINEDFSIDKELIRRKYNESARTYALFEPIQELLGVGRLRRKLLRDAYGKVLEVAVGTGVNLPHYPKGCDITAVDYSESMLDIARQRAKRIGCKVDLALMDAAELKYPDQSFDTVVSTMTLCTFTDPVMVLHEMMRVCKTDGLILLLEHGRSSWGWYAGRQDRKVHEHARRLGCVWNRNHFDLVEKAGLEIVLRERYVFGMLYLIKARPGDIIAP